MAKFQTYARFSFLAATTVIFYACKSRGQFYPVLKYLFTCKICSVLLLNMGLVITCIMWQLVKRLFLGSLREAELERLKEQSWREVTEMLYVIAIFQQHFSVPFLVMVTALLLIKSLHWLARSRVEYIETTPSVPVPSHIRMVSFMGFLLVLDCLFSCISLNSLVKARKPSDALFFSFEYIILATTTVSTFLKYVFYIRDMLMEGQWERKSMYTFYLELIHDLLHLSMYIFYFFAIYVNYGVPLNLIWELHKTLRNFRIRVSDYIRYRKITSNMNEWLPDTNPEELNTGDATCIICREEMVTAKKLLCGHLFHAHCLRSWLERQHTCPTCRSPIVPPENGSAGARLQHGVPQENHQSGSATTGMSTRTSGSDAACDNLSKHQGRLQAAALAASVYQKSFVYPPTNTSLQCPGHQLPVLMKVLHVDPSSGNESPGAAVAPGQSEQHQPFFPSDPYTSMTLLTPCSNITNNKGSASNSDLQSSLLKAQEALIQHQIEFLRTHLQTIQQQKLDRSDMTCEVSGCKERTVAASASADSVSDCGHRRDVKDGDIDLRP